MPVRSKRSGNRQCTVNSKIRPLLLSLIAENQDDFFQDAGNPDEQICDNDIANRL